MPDTLVVVKEDGTIDFSVIENYVNQQYIAKTDVNALLLGQGNYLTYNDNIYSFDNLSGNTSVPAALQNRGRQNLNEFLRLFEGYIDLFNDPDISDAAKQQNMPTLWAITHDPAYKGVSLDEATLKALITEMSQASILEEIHKDGKSAEVVVGGVEASEQRYLILNGDDMGSGVTAQQLAAAAANMVRFANTTGSSEASQEAGNVVIEVDLDAITAGSGSSVPSGLNLKNTSARIK